MADDAMAALRSKAEAIFAGLDEAANHSTGLERRVEMLARELNQAMMEATTLLRAERLADAPERCPECDGKVLNVVRERPPESGGGGEKSG